MSNPTLNGQVIAVAASGARALLDRLLERSGAPFMQWIAMNLTANSGGAIARDQLVRQMAAGIRVEAGPVEAVLDELASAGLLDPAPDGTVALTAAGRAWHASIRTGVDQISARLYGDLPAEDLATAARVLVTVADRANAELAG